MIRHLASVILFSISLFASAQNPKFLDEVATTDYKFDGKAMIYGNFVQRLGFSSGGFAQTIRIINIHTKEITQFVVKPTFKTAKENRFFYIIKPGTYAILNYWWPQSKWYGAKVFTEPIYRNIDATDGLEERIKSGQIKQSDLVQFTFTIANNSLNYLGTWHFDRGMVSFSNDKKQFDKLMAAKFKNIDFSLANLVLPN